MKAVWLNFIAAMFSLFYLKIRIYISRFRNSNYLSYLTRKRIMKLISVKKAG